MDTVGWVIVAAVLIGVIILAWVANAYRLAKKNRSLVKRGAGSRAPGEERRHDGTEQGL